MKRILAKRGCFGCRLIGLHLDNNKLEFCYFKKNKINDEKLHKTIRNGTLVSYYYLIIICDNIEILKQSLYRFSYNIF